MTGDELNPDAIDREIRLNDAWHAADEMAREQVEKEGLTGEKAEASLEAWRGLYAYDTAPDTSEHEILRAEGVEMPHSDELDDAALTERLWAIIHSLARQNTFLHNTDHLSDRELYDHLDHESFHEITKDVVAPGWTYHIDIIGSGSHEDIDIGHRYYSTEEDRARWLKSFPDDVLPPTERPPYDRDRRLPQSPY